MLTPTCPGIFLSRWQLGEKPVRGLEKKHLHTGRTPGTIIQKKILQKYDPITSPNKGIMNWGLQGVVTLHLFD